MSRSFDIVTFDCYGTLVDWEGGISGAFLSAAAADGVRLEREAVLRAHAEIEPRVQAETHRSYRGVLEETARRMAVRLGWSPRDTAFLPDSLAGWRPFADTGPALKRLRDAGHRLGILSNVDDDLLRETLRNLDVPFDLLVTAEQVGSYKPAEAHFLEARRQIGDVRWLHAAQSYFHDVEPARALSIPVAWINRKAEMPGGEARPDREFPTLTELADWLVP